MTDENKTLLGLLNGLVRKEYYGEQDITEEYLKEQLYTHISNEEFDVIVAKARGTIKVHHEMPFNSSTWHGLPRPFLTVIP